MSVAGLFQDTQVAIVSVDWDFGLLDLAVSAEVTSASGVLTFVFLA